MFETNAHPSPARRRGLIPFPRSAAATYAPAAGRGGSAGPIRATWPTGSADFCRWSGGWPGMSTASGRPGIELEDLMQAGLVALTECAQKHAGPAEDGFAAYAKMRVRGAMVDLIRRTRADVARGERTPPRTWPRRKANCAASWAAIPTRTNWPQRWVWTRANWRPCAIPASRCASIPSTKSIRTRTWPLPMTTPDSLAILADAEMRGSVIERHGRAARTAAADRPALFRRGAELGGNRGSPASVRFRASTS